MDFAGLLRYTCPYIKFAGDNLFMKKSVFMLLALLGAGMILAGCKSTSVALADHTPIAVITVVANHSLPWKEDDDPNDDSGKVQDGTLTTLVNKLINSDNIEFASGQDRVDYAMDSLTHLLEETGGFEVIDKEDVYKSKEYLNSRENIFNVLEARVKATGSKDFMKVGSMKARTFAKSLGAKSLVFAEFKFQKTNVRGNKWSGQVAASVTMRIRVLSDDGKELIDRDYSAVSADSLQIQGRKYDKDRLVEMVNETIDVVINRFIMDYII